MEETDAVRQSSFDFCNDRRIERTAKKCRLRTPGRPKPPTILQRWKAFHRANPDVFEAIRREAERERAEGWKRISINLIFELLRRDPKLQPAGGGEWKLDNSFRANYARHLIKRYPHFDGLIEIRD